MQRNDVYFGGDPKPTATAPAAIAAAQGAPLAPSDDEGKVPVRFRKTYKAHDVDVRDVAFRRPTGMDAARCGYPIRFLTDESLQASGQIEIKIVADSVSKLIVALSDPPLPRSTVDRLDIEDWNACSSVITSFFRA